MAHQPGKPPIHVTVNFIQEGDQVKINSDNIENNTEILGSNIGQITASDSTCEPEVKRTGGYKDTDPVSIQGTEKGAPNAADLNAKGFIETTDSKHVQSAAASVKVRPRAYEDEQPRMTRKLSQKLGKESNAVDNTLKECLYEDCGLRLVKNTPKDSENTRQKKGSLRIGQTEADPNLFLKEELAAILMIDAKYPKAVEILENLLEERNEQSNRLKLQVMVAECNMLIGREKRSKQDISEVIKSMTSENGPKFDDVMELVEGYYAQENFARALLLLRCNAEICKKESDSDEAIRCLKQNVAKSKCVIHEMVKAGDRLKLVAKDFGLEMMEAMLDIFRGIENPSPDVKIIEEAKCNNYAGLAYRILGRIKKSVEYYSKGIDSMKRHFKTDASKHRILGFLMANSGLANADLHNYSEAKSLLEQALEAKQNALDFTSEDEQRDSIKVTRSDLKTVRSIIKDI
ncbi:uncharacterized protein LOC120337695 [Styela clava]